MGYFCHLKNTLSGSCLSSLRVKGHQTCVTASIHRAVLPVADCRKFGQHLLTLNVDHSMASAPSGPGDYR